MNDPTTPPDLTAKSAPTPGSLSYFWLAVVNEHGVADELVDGPHYDREGVEKAMALYEQLGMDDAKYCCVEARQTEIAYRAIPFAGELRHG